MTEAVPDTRRYPRTTTFQRVLLLLILALSTFVQISVVTRSETNGPLRADAGRYFSAAYNMKYYGVYSSIPRNDNDPKIKGTVPTPDAGITPGYPLFLLLIPGIEPSLAFVHRVTLVQAFMGVFSVWLVYLISRRFLRPGTALAVTFLTAICPHLATISADVLTESLFLMLLLASTLVSLMALKSQHRWTLLAAGALWGMTSLVRPTVMFLPPLFLLAALLLPRLRDQRRAALLLLAAFIAVQAPWRVRNLVTPMAASPNLIVNFIHHGSYPNFMYDNKPESYGFPYAYDPDNARVSRDLSSVFANIAEHFRQQPLTYAKWYLVGKPGGFLSWGNINGFGDIYQYPPVRSPYLDDGVFKAMRMLSLALHWPLMLLGMGGIFAVWWRPRSLGLDDEAIPAARLVSAIALYAIGFHMIGAPFPRYAIPFRPLFFMTAMIMVSAIWRRRELPAAEVAVA